jgi:hypothetical protein
MQRSSVVGSQLSVISFWSVIEALLCGDCEPTTDNSKTPAIAWVNEQRQGCMTNIKRTLTSETKVQCFRA